MIPINENTSENNGKIIAFLRKNKFEWASYADNWRYYYSGTVTLDKKTYRCEILHIVDISPLYCIYTNGFEESIMLHLYHEINGILDPSLNFYKMTSDLKKYVLKLTEILSRKLRVRGFTEETVSDDVIYYAGKSHEKTDKGINKFSTQFIKDFNADLSRAGFKVKGVTSNRRKRV